MLLSDLYEAPVVDLAVSGMDQPGSYTRPADRKLLSNPVHAERIKTAWAKCPFDFRLFFINLTPEQSSVDFSDFDALNRYLDKVSGEIDGEALRQHFPSLDIEPKSGTITMVLLNNEASAWHPMTPWMVAHRFGHALAERSPAFKIFNDTMVRISTRLQAIFEDHAFYFQRDEIMAMIATMRSAREHTLRDYGEVLLEMLAQYIISGSIRFERDVAGRKKLQTAYSAVIEDYERLANMAAKRLLERCVGKLFVL